MKISVGILVGKAADFASCQNNKTLLMDGIISQRSQKTLQIYVSINVIGFMTCKFFPQMNGISIAQE